MNELTLELFRNLPENKQDELISLMQKLLTDYQLLFSVHH